MDSVAPAPRASFSLLETMRLEHGRVERLERHMARMAEAARYFAYPWSESTIREALAAVAREHPQGCWRLRLLLSVDGRPTIECAPHADETRPWRVPLAVRAAFRFEPARAAAMRPNELAETVLTAFCTAFERLHRP